MPKSEWPPQGTAARAELDQHWKDPYGDQRQEIVLIGCEMDQEVLTAMLDGALLTDEEFAEGQEAWSYLPDPFPAWGEEALAEAELD